MATNDFFDSIPESPLANKKRMADLQAAYDAGEISEKVEADGTIAFTRTVATDIKAEQSDYIKRFTEGTEGISHISTGSALEECLECRGALDYEDGIAYTEPFFSWRPCDTCNTPFGGNREDAHGIYDGHLIHLSVCTDCVVYIANGNLPQFD